MKSKILRIAIVLLLCISLLWPPVMVQACGPFFPAATFTYLMFPGMPLSRFGAGELGILQPTFRPEYLVVAYRYLSASPLTIAERNAALGLCEAPCDENKASAIDEWQDARKEISSVPVPKFDGPDRAIFKNMTGGTTWMDNFPNCLDPAFEKATATLTQRVRQFGKESPAVRSWVEAQDAVFSNCSGHPSANARYPDPVDPLLPEIIRMDRSYQIAAAHFYAEDFDGAGKMFQEITGDSKSPWHAIASLLVARSLIRKATLNNGEDGPDLNVLREAEKVLEKILADASLSEIHPAAGRLQGFVLFRTDPVNRLHSLGQRLARPNDPTLSQDLDDYSMLLDHRGIYGAAIVAGNGQGKMNSTTVTQDDSMTDWIDTIRTNDAHSRARAVEQWKQSGSLAWLVAALIKAQTDDPQTKDLISAARKVSPQSLAYVTVTFHRLRLDTMLGQRDNARSELDDFLKASRPMLSRSDSNLFAGLRMSLAINLNELLEFSVRAPAMTSDFGEGYDSPTPVRDDVEEKKLEKANAEPRFDLDGAWMLTRGLPTELLLQAAQNKQLPESLRSNVARATWVRAVLLDDQATALRLAPIVGAIKQKKSANLGENDFLRLRNETGGQAPDLAALMKEYEAAEAGASRRFRGILTILRAPGLRPFVEVGLGRQTPVGLIDSFRDNWWASLEDRDPKDPKNRGFISGMNSPVGEWDRPGMFGPFYVGGSFSPPEFLTESQRKAAQIEWSRLSETGMGPTWLARQVIAWAKSHPGDPRVPEALHLAVRAMRYGYAGNAELSKEAFDTLHHRYPNSEWTKKTPYWFD
jgi:hypothetical protein